MQVHFYNETIYVYMYMYVYIDMDIKIYRYIHIEVGETKHFEYFFTLNENQFVSFVSYIVYFYNLNISYLSTHRE